MPTDAKMGLLVGVVGVLAAAVMIGPKPGSAEAVSHTESSVTQQETITADASRPVSTAVQASRVPPKATMNAHPVGRTSTPHP